MTMMCYYMEPYVLIIFNLWILSFHLFLVINVEDSPLV